MVSCHHHDDMDLIKNKIDHWSEVEDEASIKRPSEKEDNSPHLVHESRSLLEFIYTVFPEDVWLMFSVKHIL